METLVTLAPLILIVVVFWLLVLRPAKARQAQQAAMLATVRPGQRIVTTAGLFGTVTEVTDDEIGLLIAPGVEVRLVRAAVGRILDDELAGPEPDLQARGDDPDRPAARPGDAAA